MPTRPPIHRPTGYDPSATKTFRSFRQKEYDANRRQRHEFYNDTRWIRAREARLRIDKGLCVMCFKEGRLTIASTKQTGVVDHVIPIEQRPDLGYDIDNLQTLCHAHHNQKHAKDTESPCVR